MVNDTGLVDNRPRGESHKLDRWRVVYFSGPSVGRRILGHCHCIRRRVLGHCRFDAEENHGSRGDRGGHGGGGGDGGVDWVTCLEGTTPQENQEHTEWRQVYRSHSHNQTRRWTTGTLPTAAAGHTWEKTVRFGMVVVRMTSAGHA